MGETTIEWTDATWNPVRGCSRVSEGCRNCYAERVAARFSGPGLAYEGLAKRTKGGPRWTGIVRAIPDALDLPLRWKEPRRIFVNSMSDLFHESLPVDFIAHVYAVMCLAPRHTFQVLTKRAARMREVLTSPTFYDKVLAAADQLRLDRPKLTTIPVSDPTKFPPRNVWNGVSVENQDAANERIPLLLQTPAAVRFLSCEPLLGRLDLDFDRYNRPGLLWRTCSTCGGSTSVPVDGGGKPCPSCLDHQGLEAGGLHWVIVGGESGTGARPCAEEWIQSVMAQCARAGVPCFVKQMGAVVVSEHRTAPAEMMGRPGELKPEHFAPNGEVWAWRAGLTDKKGADPEQFHELRVRQFPEVRHG